MDSETRARAERYWAERLSCPAEALRGPGLHVVRHPEPSAVFIAAFGAAVVAAAPESLESVLRRQAPGALLEPTVLGSLLPPGARLIGPAFVGYAETFSPPRSAVERFTAASAAPFDVLRAAAAPSEWRHANLDGAGPPIFGVVEGSDVVAAAGFVRLLDQVGHIGVVTHPGHRGRGLAQSVVAASAAAALAADLLPQYQTLVSNEASLAVGSALGFAHFTTTLAGRWDEDSPRPS